MSAVLRGYQTQIQGEIRQAWNAGAQYVMAVMGTGCGKTVTGMSLAATLPGVGVVQAHRAELVGQLSVALAEQGIRHDITASAKVRRQIVDNHMDVLGRSYYDPQAAWSVESVDTAIRRTPRRSANWVVVDEGHHVVQGNKWHRGLQQHPDARGLLLTATPCRTDGKGLGAHTDGIVNKLIVGPGLGQAMADGYLVEYDIKAPTASDLNMSDVHVGANGEFNQSEVAKAVHASNKIIGDAVDCYRQFAWGKLCIVFAVDISHARKLLDSYVAAGIPTELVTGDDLDDVRLHAMKRFKARETWVLINVDLFGEGTDVPGVEVVQMCRPTASFSLFAQQIGRMLRLDIDRLLMQMWDTFTPALRRQYIAASRKPRALLIDHVGNIYREFKIGDIVYKGPPEGFSAWSLERRGKRASSGGGGAIPQRICTGCYQSYERIYDACPFCGIDAPPPESSDIKHTDGNLYDFDPAYLAQLRAEIARIDEPPPSSLAMLGDNAGHARHAWIARQNAQHQLRQVIATWAGLWASRSDSENYRRFYHTFGIDVAQAQTLGAGDAAKLNVKIDAAIMEELEARK